MARMLVLLVLLSSSGCASWSWPAWRERWSKTSSDSNSNDTVDPVRSGLNGLARDSMDGWNFHK